MQDFNLIIEVTCHQNDFIFLYWLIFQHMNEIGCSKETKYLAKIYIDRFLIDNFDIQIEKLQLLGITAIIIAIKFNQSFRYPLYLAVENCGHQYTIDQIILYQQRLLISLNFQLKFTTPFSYLKIIKELIPIATQEIFARLEDLIQYVCLFKQFANTPSTQIFFGSLYYLSKQCESQTVSSLVLALSRNQEKTVQISYRINKNYMDQQNEENEDSTMQIQEC